MAELGLSLRADLQGPPPLALTALTAEDLAILLSWSDKDKSQLRPLIPLHARTCRCG